jgi:hypothetical protein
MVGETAQHAGHADIVKELIVAGGAGAAGRTGEPPRAGPGRG